QENLLDRRLLGRVGRISRFDRRLSAFADRDREARELVGRLRLVERSPFVVGVDGGRRDDDERVDKLLQREQLLSVLSFEGDEVDEHIRPVAERLLQSGRVSTVDLDVLDDRRKLALAAAADNNVPPPLLEPRDQRPSGLAAAAEEESSSRHRRDDSSLIS